MEARPKILVVDDDEGILNLLTDVLSPAYQVCAARDVLEAVDVLGGQPVSLVILDLNLPILGGADLLEQLRLRPEFEHTPVVVISAYPDLIKRVRGLKVQSILPKPFRLEQLSRAVAQAIESGTT